MFEDLVVSFSFRSDFNHTQGIPQIENKMPHIDNTHGHDKMISACGARGGLFKLLWARSHTMVLMAHTYNGSQINII